jgi:hypothetical protein
MVRTRETGRGFSPGSIIGSWLVCGWQWRGARRRWHVLCKCTCGTLRPLYVESLGKVSTSCGCSRKQAVVACVCCGVVFTPRPHQKACSDLCRTTTRRTERHPQIRSCGQCRGLFRAQWDYETLRFYEFCSPECYAESMQLGKVRQCIICGNEVYRNPSHNPGGNAYCSVECRNLKRDSLCGEMWLDGQPLHSDGYLMQATARIDVRGTRRTRLKYEAQYRLFVEDYIGRLLDEGEKVWHMNGNRTDDRPENLYVFKDNSSMMRAINGGNTPTVSNLNDLIDQVLGLRG